MKAFVDVRVNAEQGEGQELAAKYHVHGYPTLVIVDADANEIDRIGGYMPAEKFKPEIERILKGEGTIPALRKKAAAAPDDLAASLTLGKKLSDSAPGEAATLLEKVVDGVKRAKEKDPVLEKDAWMALVGAAGNADAPDVDHAFALIDRARKESGLPGIDGTADRMLVRLHMKAIGAALKRQALAAGDNPEALNEIAWTCFEMKVNVRDAVGWARKAADLSKGDAAILDTLANLLFLSGKTAEAVKVESDAVAAAKPPALQAELSETLVKFTRAAAQQALVEAVRASAGKGAKADEDDEGDEADEKDEKGEKDEGAAKAPPAPAPVPTPAMN